MLNDTVYGMECLKQIKCQDIRIIIGNHDTNSRIELYKTLPNICVIGYAALIKHKKWNFMLSHYPMATTNFDDDKKPFCRSCGKITGSRNYNGCLYLKSGESKQIQKSHQ